MLPIDYLSGARRDFDESFDWYECPVKKFPFRIVYRLVDEGVLIVAVAHAKRRPGYWRDRE